MLQEKPLENLVGGYSNTAIFRNIAFIGDSLSSGEFEAVDAEGNHTYHDMYEYSWGQFIARKNGLTAYNFSKGGMSAKGYLEYFGDQRDLWNKEKACQAYVIALGVNDVFGGKMPVGTKEDIEKTEFEGDRPYISYYSELVKKYKQISPDAKFFFVTLPNETGRDKEKTEAIVDALYALSEHFSNSYVINLYKYGPEYDSEFKRKYYLNGHMNPMGYLLTAQLVDSYIDYIIRTNPEDFKTVGFIGTDIKNV